MSKISLWCVLVLGCLVAVPALAQSTPVCGPLDDGRVANVFYQGTAVFFEPIVEYQYDVAVLTISGPCEDIVRTFKPGEEILFDIREIERVTDGHYTWQLRFEPTIDSGVQKELQASRGTGEEDAVWWSFWQKGAIPVGPRVESESFTVFRGSIIDPNSGEEKRANLAGKGPTASVAAAAAGVAGGGASGSEEGGGPVLGTKDQVIPDDLIVQGSLCVGFDCVNGEVFSFDTIRLKENNLRIKFDDTSGGSFPTRNWEIEINSSANGGQTHFRVNDVDAGRAPFTIEGNSPSHSLYVDSSGRVGMGTSTPVVELHVVNGDTPALRLDQNGSSGFQPQVWDVAGNETNFFVRDATGGSTLPFRIRPGAPSSSIDIVSGGDVGVGTSSPDTSLHVRKTQAGIRVESTGSATSDHASLFLQSSGGTTTEFEIRANASTGSLEVKDVAGAGSALKFQPGAANNSLVVAAASGTSARVGIGTTNPQGDAGEHSLDVNGSIYQRGAQLHSDYVFEPDYRLESIEEHAAFMWTNKHLPAVPGRKVDEAGREVIELGAHRRGMLEELEKAHIYIERLNEKIEARDQELASVKEELEKLKSALSIDG